MKYDRDKRQIETQRLLLRMFALEDAEQVCILCNNYNVYRSTLSLPFPYTIKNAQGWIEQHQEHFDQDLVYEFAITDKETGELFGCIGLTNLQAHKNGEVGYWLGEPYWNKGYATEALEAVLQFAFWEKDYHKVFSRHFASNPASGRVMQKAGMVHEGTFVDHLRKEDRYETVEYYGILSKNES